MWQIYPTDQLFGEEELLEELLCWFVSFKEHGMSKVDNGAWLGLVD